MKQKAPADWLTPPGKKLKQRNKPRMAKPRLPTEAEKQELLDYLIQTGEDTEDQRSNLEYMIFYDSFVAVFDNYQEFSGNPGKLMVIVGDMNPRGTTTFIWQDGKITEARQVFTRSGRRKRVAN